MAIVNFENAQLIPPPSPNPTVASYVALANGTFKNSSGQELNTSARNMHYIENEKKRFCILYSGVFDSSGTEFYIASRTNLSECWKIINVSFSAGDTYSFQIPVTLTCN